MSDEDDFSLAKSKIAIIGLGLMGGSLAMALKGKCAELLAVVHRSSTREQALRLQIVSQAEEDPAKILPQADVIILSTPVPAILEWLARLPDIRTPAMHCDRYGVEQTNHRPGDGPIAGKVWRPRRTSHLREGKPFARKCGSVRFTRMLLLS